MKRLNVAVLAALFLLSTGVLTPVFSNTNTPAKDTIEDAKKVDENNDEYSHESVLDEEIESEYQDPTSDDAIVNDTEEDETDDKYHTEVMEEGEEV